MRLMALLLGRSCDLLAVLTALFACAYDSLVVDVYYYVGVGLVSAPMPIVFREEAVPRDLRGVLHFFLAIRFRNLGYRGFEGILIFLFSGQQWFFAPLWQLLQLSFLVL